ncbi:hypothetical protein L2750_21190 [Shewanella submarina]|uniref:Uncharacterized protein n=1 Tax=Shewanella submarina TaxID=2016376 RepID=A0ABV7GLS8_9GAMM|nr:hypothetical protein [Shewanella submarina]MCL1039626.1 hypothetical protein [Shewanella submarina]
MNPLIRVYKRPSKSPWQDHHTVMLLADTSVNNEGDLLLGFGRYIYLHRDSQGQQLGISISKAMLADMPELESQYLSGDEMKAVLYLYLDEISAFCELFSDDFEQVFGLPPSIYIEAAENHLAEAILQLEC